MLIEYIIYFLSIFVLFVSLSFLAWLVLHLIKKYKDQAKRIDFLERFIDNKLTDFEKLNMAVEFIRSVDMRNLKTSEKELFFEFLKSL